MAHPSLQDPILKSYALVMQARHIAVFLGFLFLARPLNAQHFFDIKELKAFLAPFSIEIPISDPEDDNQRIYDTPAMPKVFFPGKDLKLPSKDVFSKLPGDSHKRPQKYVSIEPVSHVKGMQGDLIEIPFAVAGFKQVSAIQFSLAWNPKVLELMTQDKLPIMVDGSTFEEGSSIPTLSPTHFEWLEPGLLTMVWDDASLKQGGYTLSDGSVLFSLQFALVGEPGSRSLVSLVDKPTPIRFVTAEGESVDVVSRPSLVAVQRSLQIKGSVKMLDCDQCPVEGATVILKQKGKEYVQYTDAEGQYAFDMDPGSPVVIEASMEVEASAAEAVDVSDMLSLRRHILGRAPMKLARQMIAADVNGDQSIDVEDIVAMRKVILARIPSFEDKTNQDAKISWRFVSERFKQQASTGNAFEALQLDQSLDLGAPQTSIIAADFYGIKLGDANGDWTPKLIRAPRPGRR